MGQLAHSEDEDVKLSFYNSAPPIAMAEPYAQSSFCQNSLPAGKNKLAKIALRALTNDSGTFSYTFAVSYVPTLAPALLLASAKLVIKYINADL